MTAYFTMKQQNSETTRSVKLQKLMILLLNLVLALVVKFLQIHTLEKSQKTVLIPIKVELLAILAVEDLCKHLGLYGIAIAQI